MLTDDDRDEDEEEEEEVVVVVSGWDSSSSAAFARTVNIMLSPCTGPVAVAIVADARIFAKCWDVPSVVAARG